MKLMKYAGSADSRVITAKEFADAGIPGIATMSFDQSNGFYNSVSDLVAIFLLTQGDFVAEDGATLFDIYQNAVTEAVAEVFSVNGQVGEVLLPGYPSGSDAAAGTPAMRRLGRAAGKALPGDDPLVADALTKTMFTEDVSVVLFKDSEGDVQALVVPPSSILGRKASGEIVAMTYSEVQAIISSPEGGFSLDDLTDVNVPGVGPGVVLGSYDGATWQPMIVGSLTASTYMRRGYTDLIEVDALPSSVSLTTTDRAGKSFYAIMVTVSDAGTLSIVAPPPDDQMPFYVSFIFTEPRSGDFQLNVNGIAAQVFDPTESFAKNQIVVVLFAPNQNDDVLGGDPYWAGFPLLESIVKVTPLESLEVVSGTATIELDQVKANQVFNIAPEEAIEFVVPEIAPAAGGGLTYSQFRLNFIAPTGVLSAFTHTWDDTANEIVWLGTPDWSGAAQSILFTAADDGTDKKWLADPSVKV